MKKRVYLGVALICITGLVGCGTKEKVEEPTTSMVLSTEVNTDIATPSDAVKEGNKKSVFVDGIYTAKDYILKVMDTEVRDNTLVVNIDFTNKSNKKVSLKDKWGYEIVVEQGDSILDVSYTDSSDVDTLVEVGGTVNAVVSLKLLDNTDVPRLVVRDSEIGDISGYFELNTSSIDEEQTSESVELSGDSGSALKNTKQFKDGQ